MNCKIVGYEYKTLEVTLSPGESFYAERGSIVWVDEALQRDAEMNGGRSGKQHPWKNCRRCAQIGAFGRVCAHRPFL